MKECLIVMLKSALGQSTLVVIELQPPYSVNAVLDAYAKHYAFDRNRLTGYIVQMVSDPSKS